MKIFDFNIHLPPDKADSVEEIVAQDRSMGDDALVEGLRNHRARISKITGANFLLFNTSIARGEGVDSFKSEISGYAAASMTALIDHRSADLLGDIERLAEYGISGVMVNSYIQQIEKKDYAQVLAAFRKAGSLGMFVCIDGSFGTSKMDVYDNLALACGIADALPAVPIVIIHSGGLRIMKFMLLALDKKNVRFDTSFSLPFYLGSSLEQDFAFAYRKIGSDRVMFGSDHPYHEWQESYEVQLKFFDKAGFSAPEIEQIFYYTAYNLLHG